MFDVFDFVFNQKLSLFESSDVKFGKNNFNLLQSNFTKDISYILEDLLINSIRNNFKKCEKNKNKLVDEIKTGMCIFDF